MPKSITVKQKKRGRPATGRAPFYGIRIPEELSTKIDEWARKHNAPSLSDAIRQLIEKALKEPD